jgi:DNA-binding NtrC family response regulator/predicted hydrocarbon binding protein
MDRKSTDEALGRLSRGDGADYVSLVADLSARLRFSPTDGQIWLDDQRMLLIHLSSMTALRKELMDSLGMDQARGLLTRMGYNSGVRDAQLARRVRAKMSFDEAFLVGPQLHGLEGQVSVEPVTFEWNVETGHFFGEFIWRNSAEVECHLQAYGLAAEPVCWSQIGYASGYTSAFMGRPILFREVECRGAGHSRCRIIGKPVEAWGPDARDAAYVGPLTPPPRTADLAAAPDSKSGTVGASSGYVSACHLVERVAPTMATVLFLGETGVGKEVFARMLHTASPRAGKPFVAVNCAAIPETLIEAELFGVEKGAFTGALTSRPGRFERANGGTLFLDEVGTLSLTAQGKLLRALQEGEIERVGDTTTRKVDVRVIAATNVPLREEVRAGRFRDDLYFRLNVFPIELPPLRERRDDIPLLMNHFLRRFCDRHGRHLTGFTERAVDRLMTYRFPGNIRELENMIERAVILAPEQAPIDVGHLFSLADQIESPFYGIMEDGQLALGGMKPTTGAANQIVNDLLAGPLNLEQFEEQLIAQAVDRAGGNLTLAAKMLGLTRAQLAYRYRQRH